MKRWTRIFLALTLSALVCATLAAADFQDPASRPTPLNCHEMAAMLFGGQEDGATLFAPDESDETEAALAEYFAAREAAYRGDMRLLSADDESMSASVAETNDLRAERVKEMESRLNVTVLDADVSTRIERARTVSNPDGTETLYVYEWTYYDYDDLADGVGGMDVSGFGTWHILTIGRNPDGSPLILSDEYDESDLFEINTLSEEGAQELMERGLLQADFGDADETVSDEDSASLMAFAYYPDYDVNKAVAYAEQYWGGVDGAKTPENYNPAYANFNSVGGDCANFTSQCIYAGGMPQVVCSPYGNDGWYYKSANDRSATWTGATNLHHWMRDNRGRCVTASNTTVFTGSPVFYSVDGYPNEEARTKKTNIRFNHAVICVGTNSAGTPIINSHNNDRYHAIWNYYSKTDIDTVQLTSKSFGSFSGYVKPGTDFHAYLMNPSLNRYVTNDGGGKVASRAKTEESGQVWHFLLQDDGSYQILSELTNDSVQNACLAGSSDAASENWPSRTYVRAETYSDSPGKRWYFYWNGGEFSWGKGAYQLRLQGSDRVLDIFEGSADEGAALWIFTKNDTEAQLFQFQQVDWIVLDKPTLHVDLSGDDGVNVKFTWFPIDGAGSYVVRILRDGTVVRTAAVQNASYALNLDPGHYEATLEAVSANERTSSLSDPISFTVYHSYDVIFDANGGVEPPEPQLKIEATELKLTENVPTYEGYIFSSWNTEANGTGASYQSGGIYENDEPLTLYAQWDPATYAVTFNPNRGELEEGQSDTQTVTFNEPYGQLPTPRRGQYEFSGWYTAPEEGEGALITEATVVSLAKDHTLYAHWESSIAYISSVVTQNGEYHQVRTSVYKIKSGVLFVCGYLNGQLMAVESQNIAQNEEVTLQGDFDVIRVMALDDTNHMRPQCPAYAVQRRQFH